MDTITSDPQDPCGRQFCGKCGKVLTFKPHAKYYNIDTGEPEYHWTYWCPDKRFWNSHTKFRCDQNGSTYSYEA